MPLLARIVLYLIGGYLLLCVIIYWTQQRHLYFPDKTAPDPSALKEIGLRRWPDTGAGFRGYRFNAEHADAGTVIVFHGNAGAAWQRDYYGTPLASYGYRVILAEYPGYGGRSGSPSEETLIADARNTIRIAADTFPGPVVVFGESLGAAVAAGAAADSTLRIRGLCLITPWAELTALARSLYPFLPVRLLLRDQYDSQSYLSAYTGRIAVAVAEADEVVTAAQGLALFESLQTDKQLWMMKGAAHNTWMYRVDPRFWKEILDFLLQS